MVATQQRRDPQEGSDAIAVRTGEMPVARRKSYWRRMRPMRRFAAALLIVFLPAVLLVSIALGVAYVRLSNGPVSLSYLKPAIERQIAEKLGGLRVAVSDVVLSLADQGAEFRLTDVSVRNADNVVVAQAPLASMTIDRAALFKGQVIPTGIVLIRPRMRLGYDKDGGLSLSFRRSAAATDGADQGQTGGRAIRASSAGTESEARTVPVVAAGNDAPAGSITVMRSIAEFLSNMASSDRARQALDRIGVRNAIIEIDYAGRVSRWGVPSGDLDIKRYAGRSVVSGLATVVEAQGQNIVLAFHAEADDARKQIALRTSVRDLRPAAIAQMSPALASLKRIRSTLSAEALFNIRSTGEIINGTLTTEFGAGQIDIVPGDPSRSLQLDHGRMAFRFDGSTDAVTIEPTTFGWGGGNEVLLTGAVKGLAPRLKGAEQRPGGDGWSFALRAEKGHLVAKRGDSVRVPVDELSFAGRLLTSEGRLAIDNVVMRAGGGGMVLKGSIDQSNIATRYQFEGRIGPGPISGLQYLWPEASAPDARAWVRANVTSGRVTGGRFESSWREAASIATTRRSGWSTLAVAAADPGTQSLVLRGQDARIVSPFGQAAAYAHKFLVRFDGRQLEVSAPTGEIRGADRRSVRIKQARFDVADLMSRSSIGRLSVKLDGKARDGVALLAASPWAGKSVSDVPVAVRQRLAGRLSGTLEFAIPLDATENQAPTVTGKIALRDIALKDAIGRHDISGGVIDLSLASKSVKADGEMLIEGVATKLVWQYILDAPLESQPPLRLQASLDEADRDKLGIKINHIVRGIVDVEVNLVPRTAGAFGARVRADATRASIAIRSLAWVKPTGRQTQVEFDVVAGKAYPVRFDNLRVVSDGVAISGQAMLDSSYQLRAFKLPLFSIDRVTRLELEGKLAKGKIWRVVARGQTFEGRALFRSLFQTGRVTRAAAVPPDQQYGVDLEAEVATVLGFWNSRMKNVRMSLSKRNGKIRTMKLSGRLDGDKLLRAKIVSAQNGRRQLQAYSEDAGKAFTLVGFYPNAETGKLELVVDLDGQGVTEKAGILLVRRFSIRGDKVVGELARAPRRGIKRRRAKRNRKVENQALEFDWMRVPFVIGNGQFILQGAELRGPVVGATIEGKADFDARFIDLSGTYVPLQGLNGALGVIPALGQLLAGPKGEGVLGMKFAVRGPMGAPEMLVNPLSIMAPGIFREIFQITNPSLEVTRRQQRGTGAEVDAPRQNPRRQPKKPRRKDRGWRSNVFGEQ